MEIKKMNYKIGVLLVAIGVLIGSVLPFDIYKQTSVNNIPLQTKLDNPQQIVNCEPESPLIEMEQNTDIRIQQITHNGDLQDSHQVRKNESAIQEKEDDFDIDYYITVENSVLRDEESFQYGLKKWHKQGPIEQWGIDKEHRFSSEIPWGSSIIVHSTECRETMCMIIGEAESKDDFYKVYEAWSSDDTFVGFYGNHFAFKQNEDGKFIWYWGNFKQ